MPQDDALHQRGHALEEAFFKLQDAKLLEQLQQQDALQTDKQEIAAATGIRDDAVLAKLHEAGIHLQTLTALSIIPLVEVAWADGRIEKNERDAVLAAADEAGIAKDGPGYQLLTHWLAARPDAQLLSYWKDYVAALGETLDADGLAQVREDILARARGVATAAGGILGIGSISDDEKDVLAQLEAAFSK